MHVHLRELAARQDDIVAGWQLLAVGWTPRMVEHRVRAHGWRVVHRGVYALTRSPMTRRQRWIAATLTAPGTVLSHASAGALWGFRPCEGRYETVTRPGSGGSRRHGGVLVLRSTVLDGHTTRRRGIPVTTAARALIELAPQLDPKATGRAFREALRLKATSREQLRQTLDGHPGHRGTALLRELADRYASIPYGRTRSNAEARALEVLHDAGAEPPRVNTRVAGEEADLAWPGLIVEIDGPDYHRFPEEDARKQRRWEAAGYTVRRLDSGSVYDRPERLIVLATRI
jgi:hypothetical protein